MKHYCTHRTNPNAWWMFLLWYPESLALDDPTKEHWLECRGVKPCGKIWRSGFTEQMLRNGKSYFVALSTRWCGGWKRSRGKLIIAANKTLPRVKLFSSVTSSTEISSFTPGRIWCSDLHMGDMGGYTGECQPWERLCPPIYFTCVTWKCAYCQLGTLEQDVLMTWSTEFIV